MSPLKPFAFRDLMCGKSAIKTVSFLRIVCLCKVIHGGALFRDASRHLTHPLSMSCSRVSCARFAGLGCATESPVTKYACV
jgi:hypothetical protein